MILDLTPVSQDPGPGQLHLDQESQNRDQEHPDLGPGVGRGLGNPRVHQDPDRDLLLLLGTGSEIVRIGDRRPIMEDPRGSNGALKVRV